MSKAILISDHAKWCALIMNGEKTVEVRRNKALASAIQKLIDENGYADIYVYCSKSNYFGYISNRYIGKVVFKFRCYKVEEINRHFDSVGYSYKTKTLNNIELFENSCLNIIELDDYLNLQKGYAIYISDLEIFDEPKCLCDFWNTKKGVFCCPLTKAPQNFVYIIEE